MYNNRKPNRNYGGYKKTNHYGSDLSKKTFGEDVNRSEYSSHKKPYSSRPSRNSGGYGSFAGLYNRTSSGSFRNNRSRRKTSSKTIDPQMFVKKAEYIEQEAYMPKHTFADFTFSTILLQNVLQKGYTHPTPIQDMVIPEGLNGKDILGIASTGTGKTAAFALPILHMLHANKSKKALIITPTRELALQIQNEFRSFGRGMYVFDTLCIGGANIGKQLYQLQKNPQIVIGTPGRLKDLSDRRAINFNEYQILVLDEMDQMLDMGFIHDIRFIVEKMALRNQTMLFSATMRSDIEQIAHSFLKEPHTVKLNNNSSSKNVDQDIVKVSIDDKLAKLKEMLKEDHFEKVLIFVRTKRSADKLTNTLLKDGFKTDTIHGDKSQRSRQIALDRFKKNNVTILIATDVAARGLDIDNVTHVINYDAPEQYEDYIHRIGRTGRAGKKGYAYTFVH